MRPIKLFITILVAINFATHTMNKGSKEKTLKFKCKRFKDSKKSQSQTDISLKDKQKKYMLSRYGKQKNIFLAEWRKSLVRNKIPPKENAILKKALKKFDNLKLNKATLLYKNGNWFLKKSTPLFILLKSTSNESTNESTISQNLHNLMWSNESGKKNKLHTTRKFLEPLSSKNYLMGKI